MNDDVSKKMYEREAIDPALLAEDRAGYKIYLRVPANADNITVKKVQDFITEFITLLDDPDKGITVEAYGDIVDEVELRDYHTGVTGQEIQPPLERTESYPDSSGGPGSALIPLYVCHHK